ncbi:hypothetical protein [Dehalogenimonas sp. 4OHTPN]|uniref:Uncharacterized protein n=1 Tax=Dehalogenimonas sp. 4OHTPN TaxID=3166643 RepID=A0AAU8GB46_9CHLR
MWLVLLAAAISTAAWLADLHASRIPIREERRVDVYPDSASGGGISRLLDR